MMKRWTLGLLVAALALTVAGCSAAEDKISEEIGEEIAGGIVGGDVEVDDGSVTISGEDGDVTISDYDGDVPEGFPGDFPVYGEADLDAASSSQGEDGMLFFLSLTSDDAPDVIYDWYKAEFEAEGWETVSDMNTSADDGMTAIINVKKGDVEGSVTISSNDDGSDLGIIATEK